MGVKGDFAGLEHLRKQFEALASDKARTEMVAVCAEAAIKVLDDQFRASVDPYGNPWKPLKFRIGGKPLMDTGVHLRNTLNPKVSPSGFTIMTAFVGAAVHQYGATIYPKKGKFLRFQVRGQAGFIYAKKVVIPRRQYMPERDVGPKWKAGLEHAAKEYVRKAVEK